MADRDTGGGAGTAGPDGPAGDRTADDGGGRDGDAMWRTNLKIVATVLLTIGVYTLVANVIPQVESEVPEDVEIGSDVTAAELADLGEEIYQGAGGCQACHGAGTRAPQLLGEIGARCGDRVEGMGCKEYLHESMVDPNAYVVEGFQPIMPDMSAQLSGEQIWAVVAFLQSQGGEVTVTPDDLEGAGADGGEDAGSGGADAEGSGDGAAAPGSGDDAGATALFTEYGCTACHQVGGEGGQAAPSVEAIQAQELSPEYVRRSILEPDADTASGYDQDWSAFAGTMPANFDERLSEEELETLVDYMSAREGP